MYCSNCGAQVQNGISFCPNCGISLSQTYTVTTSGMTENEMNSPRYADNNPTEEVLNINNVYNQGRVSNIYQYRLKTDRSLLVYIALTIITCGIYGYYFIYKWAEDVNIACADDGNKTEGFATFILLGIVTCGIYCWIWYYQLGNRLNANARRYGLYFAENGTTVLMWMLFGILLCGIGPL